MARRLCTIVVIVHFCDIVVAVVVAVSSSVVVDAILLLSYVIFAAVAVWFSGVQVHGQLPPDRVRERVLAPAEAPSCSQQYRGEGGPRA